MKRIKNVEKLVELFKAGESAYNDQWLARDNKLMYRIGVKAVPVAEKVGNRISTTMPTIANLMFVHQAETAIKRMIRRLENA